MKTLLTTLVLTIIFSGGALAEPFAYVANFDSNDVSVVDLSTNKVTATVDVGTGPIGVAVANDGKSVYVSNNGDSTVSVINTSDNEVIATIDDAGDNPEGLAASPDGKFVYVAYDNGVSKIQTSDNSVVDTMEVGGDTLTLELTTEGKLIAREDIPSPTEEGKIKSLVVTPDDKFVYITNIIEGKLFILQTSNFSELDSITLAGATTGIAVTPDGEFIYIPSDSHVDLVRVSDNTIVDSIDGVGDEPRGVAVTPDGDFVYVVFKDGLSVIEVATNKVVDTINTADDFLAELTGIAISSDGEFVYANGFTLTNADGVLIVVKTSDNKLDTAVEVGKRPLALAITPDQGLGEGDPEDPQETSSGKNNSCAIAGPGAASSYLPLLLLLPAFILIRRLWRGRGNITLNGEA